MVDTGTSADDHDEDVLVARHRRVEELIHALTAPTFRWRMANGVAGQQTLGRPRDPLVRSAETRRLFAERDLEDAVLAWYAEHFGGE